MVDLGFLLTLFSNQFLFLSVIIVIICGILIIVYTEQISVGCCITITDVSGVSHVSSTFTSLCA